MAALENKIDFAVVFAANNANPNGDPLNGNRPRTTSEGLGEVSDVALKRKIRNRLQDAGETIFVQSDDRSDDGAKSLSDRFNTYMKTLPKEEQKQKNLVFQKVCEQWLDVRTFGQVFAFSHDVYRIHRLFPYLPAGRLFLRFHHGLGNYRNMDGISFRTDYSRNTLLPTL